MAQQKVLLAYSQPKKVDKSFLNYEKSVHDLPSLDQKIQITRCQSTPIDNLQLNFTKYTLQKLKLIR